MGDTHLLKIISGSHAGAEIDLEHGTYTLGRHEDCDYILTDDALSDQHLEIKLDDTGLVIKSLCEHAFIIDGKEVGLEISPEIHTVITTSSLSFVFGQKDKPWPSLMAPTAMPLNAQQGQTQVPASDSSTAKRQDEKHSSDNAASNPQETKSGHQNKKMAGFSIKALLNRVVRWFRRFRWFFIAMTVLVILAALSYLFVLFWQKTDPADNAAPAINYMAVAESIKTRLQLPDITIRQLTDGVILIRGYVKDSDQKNTLLAKMEEESVPVKERLTVMSDMRLAAVTALKTAGYTGINIELDTTPGSLVLSGYAPDTMYVTKVRDLLRTEVYGLTSIVEQLEYQSTREKALRSVLRDNGLLNRIKILTQPGVLTLEGRLSDIAEGYSLKKIVADYREKYDNHPRLVINVTIPSANTETLQPELHIRSISLGRMPYVVLENGEKYLPGAKLENGYILESIGLDYLVLSLGQKRIKYYVRENNG